MSEVAVQQEAVPIPWWLVLLQGIAAIILGILLITNTALTAVLLVQFLGIYWMVSGIFAIISIFIDSEMWGWKLFSGILGIIAGVIILQHPFWSTLLVPTVLVIVIGIQGLIIGIVNLIQAFQGAGWGIGVLGILSILFGLILLFNPILGAVTLPFVAGIFGIVGGIAAVVMAFRLR
jgi:uncharacterized membrane protein HdeD (DUF308 family)